jgi:drug/metabolite transporter (DMT)-like permease
MDHLSFPLSASARLELRAAVPVAAAFAAIYLIWGSTYLAVRIAVETIPPLLMIGIRSLTAGAVLYVWARRSTGSAPTRREWANAALIGILLFAGGHGLLAVAQQHADSGISAVLLATIPLWVPLLAWLIPATASTGDGGKSRRRPRREAAPSGRELTCLTVGFAAVAVLVWNAAGRDAAATGLDPGSAALLLASAFSWALGTVMTRRLPLPASPVMAAGCELLIGGAAVAAIGAARGEATALDPGAITAGSLLSLAYLIVAGSIVGFSAFVWLLDRVPATRVATYAYVNPVIAVLLGWALAGETVNATMLAAGAVVLAAVAGIVAAPDRRP